MAEFSYRAVDKSGVSQAGVIEAADKRAAISLLAVNELFVTEIDRGVGGGNNVAVAESEADTKPDFSFRNIKSKDVVAFTTQLSTAIRAGLPLLEAIGVVQKQQKNEKLRALLAELSDAVSGGDSLSEAMEKRSDVFSKLYISMVRSGEAAGILDNTFEQLVNLLKREEDIKTRIKNASLYPLIVLVVGIISVGVAIRFVLPKILETIIDAGAALPLPTRILLGMSDFLQDYGLIVVVGIVAAVVCFLRYRKTGSGRIAIDAFRLKVPVLGGVVRTIAVGRFARTLGSLLKSGITIVDALGVVRDTLGNEILGRAIDDVSEKVKAGQPLAEPLEESGLFPALLVQIVSVGEHTGKLDELLLNAAETFDSEADNAVERFMAVFPVVLILGLGLIVLLLVLATLMPILLMSMGGGVL